MVADCFWVEILAVFVCAALYTPGLSALKAFTIGASFVFVSIVGRSIPVIATSSSPSTKVAGDPYKDRMSG